MSGREALFGRGGATFIQPERQPPVSQTGVRQLMRQRRPGGGQIVIRSGDVRVSVLDPAKGLANGVGPSGTGRGGTQEGPRQSVTDGNVSGRHARKDAGNQVRTDPPDPPFHQRVMSIADQIQGSHPTANADALQLSNQAVWNYPVREVTGHACILYSFASRQYRKLDISR